MISAVLLLFAGMLISFGLVSMLPKGESSSSKELNRIMKVLGYTSAKQKAQLIGWNLRWQDYILLIVLSVFSGYAISKMTGNELFTIAGGALCFVVPSFIVNWVQQKRRKEMISDFPHNMRLLVSKLRDCKSVLLSLEKSLPIMNGPTKAIFLKIYTSLELGIPLWKTLQEVQDEVKYQKFDDFCEKLRIGQQEGFHTKAIDNLRDSVEDTVFDVEVIKEIDIKNVGKRVKVFFFVGISFLFPFLTGYMESEVATRTIDTPIGKVLLLSMFVSSIATILASQRYLKLNLRKL